MMSLPQRALLFGGMAVLVPLLLLAGWRLAHSMLGATLVTNLADGRAGRLLFTSYNAQWSDLSTGAFRDHPVNVPGHLSLPDGEDGQAPAVILMHGSDGVTRHQDAVARKLRALGIATFVIDSFTTRHVDNTISDPTAVTPYSMLIDAFQALALLQTHPGLDPQRIAVVGWSKGGMVADWASRTRYRALVSRAGAAFAAHVAFYPWCGEQHVPIDLTGAPLLYLVGARDDWTGAGPCSDYVRRVRAAGYRAMLVTYADAEHGFDFPGHFRRYLPSAVSWAQCNYIWSETRFRVVASGEQLPWSEFEQYIQHCTSRGAHVASNALARRDASRQLRDFLMQALAPSKPG